MIRSGDDPASAGSAHRPRHCPVPRSWSCSASGSWRFTTARGEAAAAAAGIEAPPIPLSSVARARACGGRTDSAGPCHSRGPTIRPLQLLVPAEDGTGQFRVLTGLRQADGSVLAVVRGVVSRPRTPRRRPVGRGSAGWRTAAQLRNTWRALIRSNGQIDIRCACRLWHNSGPGPLIDGFVTLSQCGRR